MKIKQKKCMKQKVNEYNKTTKWKGSKEGAKQTLKPS